MLIVMVIHAIQQFTGINAVVFYLADIFLDAGFNIEDSLSAAALVTLTQVLFVKFCLKQTNWFNL